MVRPSHRERTRTNMSTHAKSRPAMSSEALRKICSLRPTMRAALTFTLLVSAACLLGCQSLVSSPSVAPAQSAAVTDLEQRVGQRVVLEGIVTNTKCPQIQGVDVWGLEDYRGQRVRVSGVLRKSVVTAADIDPMVANRGAGTFYSFDDMKYELLK
jgi:hypothetical protein